MLQIQVNSKQTLLATQGARIYYVDIYGPVMDLISRHQNLGELFILSIVLLKFLLISYLLYMYVVLYKYHLLIYDTTRLTKQ